MNRIEAMLAHEYDIQVQNLQAVPPGWSAAAWKVHAENGDYFLKVYDKHRPSVKELIARIDCYIPVILWLHENTGLKAKMAAPLFTRDGEYKKEDSDFLYMVFPFIEGRTISEQHLNPVQIQELALIISELHKYNAEIPVSTDCLLETFDVSFCEDLENRIKDPYTSEPLKAALNSYTETVGQNIEVLRKLAVSLPKSKLQYALCHTDLHGWNLIQSEQLTLIDWEGLTLAPVEADLFAFTESFFLDYAWEAFINIYCTEHENFQLNPDAMHYYRLRRRLVDIHEFVESILFDDLSEHERIQSLAYLKKECGLLAAIKRGTA